MLMSAYSALSEMSAVMAPGPAMRGNATGTILAPDEEPSFFINSRPVIISRESMKRTAAPATAKDGVSMLNSLRRASPTKKNTTNSPRATAVA